VPMRRTNTDGSSPLTHYEFRTDHYSGAQDAQRACC
jgi:hypothetical protein